MSLISWPFKRKQYSGIANPRYVSDIVAANEAVIDAIKSITGLTDSDFAIISGMVYDPTAHTYGAGIFYLSGSFYSIASVNEGQYVIGGTTDIMNSPFPDSTSKPIYTQNTGIATSSSSGASPVFNSTMNQYRISLSKLKYDLSFIQEAFASLGNSAGLDVGVGADNVAAGNASYSKAAIDAMLATVDRVLAKGSYHLGDLSHGATFTIPVSLSTDQYTVQGTMKGTGSHNTADICSRWIELGTTSSGFTIYVDETGSTDVQDLTFEYRLYAK